MANLFFPQLSSGALAQYPLRRMLIQRSIKNILADGSMIMLPDPGAARMVWQLAYTGLSGNDMAALASHFAACEARLQGFTFIDPTGNMLVNSANLKAAGWLTPSTVTVTENMTDPAGGAQAFEVVNAGQATQELVQTVTVPGNYEYCFSLYACSSAQNGSIALIRRGSSIGQSTTAALGAQWTRIVSSGRLSDTGTSITVGFSLLPGQQVYVYGPQLEAQPLPSRYRATGHMGGVYANAHWAVDQLPMVAEGPNLFGTAFTIETVV